MNLDAYVKTRPIPSELLHNLGYMRGPGNKISERPTEHELRVLTCLSHGLTLAQAAEVLGVGFETVRTQAKTARLRLGAKNTTHAVATALRLEMIL